MMTKDFYPRLKAASETILKLRLACLPEPSKPINRTRQWGTPRGICYHYTGGPNAIRSIQWFNNPQCGNRVSSAHVLIYDRITDDYVGRDWLKIVPKEIRYYFPVPTLILADWFKATWCSNWANAYCLGVENRNAGYNILPKGQHPIPGKAPWVSPLGVAYEPYTREQIICNISIGKLFKAVHPTDFDPDYILGHQGVWAEKSDPGPAFPIHRIRSSIMDSLPHHPEFPWLDMLIKAPTVEEPSANAWIPTSDFRDTDMAGIDAHTDDGCGKITDPEKIWLTDAFAKLGYNVQRGLNTERLKVFTTFFQRSTAAYADNERKKSRVLKIDGVPGPQTQKILFQRLCDLKIEIRLPPKHTTP